MAVLIGNEVKKLFTSLPIDAVAGTPSVLWANVFSGSATTKSVITSVELRCTAASGITDEATVSVRIQALISFTPVPLLSVQKLSGVVSADDRWTVRVEGGAVVVPANAGFIALIFDSTATGTSQTLVADVFGYLLN